MNNTIVNTYNIAEQTAEKPTKQSVLSVLFLAFLFLASAHLAIKDFFPNPAVWVIGAGLIVALGSWWIVIRQDEFGFLLALFICCHFAFADNQGGLWSYVLLATVFIGFTFNSIIIKLSSIPWYINLLVLIFFFHQILGTIYNEYSFISNIQSTAVAISQLIVFYYFATQEASSSNLKRFFSAWFILICWIFFSALNQQYHWVKTPSPLLPQRYMAFGKISSIPAGSFGNSELFAEYFCMIFAMALTIISHFKELAKLRIKLIFPLLIILISTGSLIMGASRAAVLLAVAAAVFIFVTNFIATPSFNNLKRILLLLFSFLTVALMIWEFGSYFGMADMIDDFSHLNPSKISVENVISGKGINRTFKPAYRRLSNGSWWVGNGFNLPENNTQSLGLAKGASDYHSLYLCLPFFYGWLGAASFVLIVILTGSRIFIYYLKSLRSKHFLMPIAFGLSIVWGIFLMDQYKISITRNPSYFLMTWMMLGLTHSISNSIRKITSQVTVNSNY